jgi:hypothetical protein
MNWRVPIIDCDQKDLQPDGRGLVYTQQSPNLDHPNLSGKEEMYIEKCLLISKVISNTVGKIHSLFLS